MERDKLQVLIERSRQGDTRAFSDIVRMFHAEVRGFLSMNAVERDWIDDLAQEVFVAAYRSLSRFDMERSFQKWLRGIANNVVKRHGERRARDSKLRGDEVSAMVRRRQESVREGTGAEEVQNAAPVEALRTCLERLPEHLREVIRLRYFKEHSSFDIARALNRTATAVRVALMRARRSLLRCIRMEVGHEPFAY